MFVSQLGGQSPLRTSALNVLRSALGLPCWQVRWDGQVGLDMNFGAPRMELRAPRDHATGSSRVRAMFSRRGVRLKGTHWLVAYPGCWRLQTSDGLSVRDTHSVKRLGYATARLTGELLDGFAIHPRTGRTELFFDLGGRVTVRLPRIELDGDSIELWSMHNRTHGVTVYSDGRYGVSRLREVDKTLHVLDPAEWVVVARTIRRQRAIAKELPEVKY